MASERSGNALPVLREATSAPRDNERDSAAPPLTPSASASSPAPVLRTSVVVMQMTPSDAPSFGIKSLDTGGVIGGGIAFSLGTVGTTVGARFQHGFADIAKDASVRNRVLSLYARVEFGMP